MKAPIEHKHTGKADCPACEVMHTLAKIVTAAINENGLDNGLNNADCINVLTRVLATGIVHSAIPGKEANATAAVAAQLISDTGTLMQAMGKLTPDNDATVDTLSPEQLQRMMLLPEPKTRH